jgi:hypothetical protein
VLLRLSPTRAQPPHVSTSLTFETRRVKGRQWVSFMKLATTQGPLRPVVRAALCRPWRIANEMLAASNVRYSWHLFVAPAYIVREKARDAG